MRLVFLPLQDPAFSPLTCWPKQQRGLVVAALTCSCKSFETQCSWTLHTTRVDLELGKFGCRTSRCCSICVYRKDLNGLSTFCAASQGSPCFIRAALARANAIKTLHASRDRACVAQLESGEPQSVPCGSTWGVLTKARLRALPYWVPVRVTTIACKNHFGLWMWDRKASHWFGHVHADQHTLS